MQKIDQAAKQLIVELAVAGKTSAFIAAELFIKLNIGLEASAVRYWRAKLRSRIVKLMGDSLAAAYATQPLAALENRLAEYAENIQREKEKASPDRKVINDALFFAGKDVNAAETLRLKSQELLFKKELKDGADDDESVSFFATMEKRLVISKVSSAKNQELIALAGWKNADQG